LSNATIRGYDGKKYLDIGNFLYYAVVIRDFEGEPDHDLTAKEKIQRKMQQNQ
jgi:hypothetical protein